ncbi:MAG: hypothetical protein WDM85_01285 [Caulobacteraceae bacterium]
MQQFADPSAPRHSRRNGDLVSDKIKRFLAGTPGVWSSTQLAEHAAAFGIVSARPIAQIQTTLRALHDEGLVERRRNVEGQGGAFVYYATEALKEALASKASR